MAGQWWPSAPGWNASMHAPAPQWAMRAHPRVSEAPAEGQMPERHPLEAMAARGHPAAHFLGPPAPPWAASQTIPASCNDPGYAAGHAVPGPVPGWSRTHLSYSDQRQQAVGRSRVQPRPRAPPHSTPQPRAPPRPPPGPQMQGHPAFFQGPWGPYAPYAWMPAADALGPGSSQHGHPPLGGVPASAMPPYSVQHGMFPGYFAAAAAAPGPGAMPMMGQFASAPAMWASAAGAGRPEPERGPPDEIPHTLAHGGERPARWQDAYPHQHPHVPPRKRPAGTTSPSSAEDAELSEEERWTVVSKTSSGRVVKRRTLPGHVDDPARPVGAAAAALGAGLESRAGHSAPERAAGSPAAAAAAESREQAAVTLEEAERRQRRMESNRISAQRSRVRNSQMSHLATRAARGALALCTLPAVALSVDERLRVVSSSAGVADGVALTDLLASDAATDAMLARIRGATQLVRAAMWLQDLLEAVLRRRLGGFEITVLVLALARRRLVPLHGALTASFAAEGPCAVLESQAPLRLAAAAERGVAPPPDALAGEEADGTKPTARPVRARIVVRPDTPAHSLVDRINWVLADGTDLRRQAFREKRLASGRTEWRERERGAASRTRQRLDATDPEAATPAAAAAAAGGAGAAAAGAELRRREGTPQPGAGEHCSGAGAILRAPQGPHWWRNQAASSGAAATELGGLLSDSLCAMAFRDGEGGDASLALHVALHPC